MYASRLPGPLSVCIALLVAAIVGCAPAEEAPATAAPKALDLPYGEAALVVIVNARLDATTTRQVTAPGESVSGVYVESQEGARAYTDSSGIAVLSGIKGGYTVLSLEGDGETGQVGVQVAETGLTEVYIALRPDGAFPISQTDWVGGEAETLAVSASAGVAITSIGPEYAGRVYVMSEDDFGADLEIRADNVLIYGEGFMSDWPFVAGSVRVYGNNVQMRGVWVGGGLDVYGNNFAMNFGGVELDTLVKGNNVTFLDTVFCDTLSASGEGLLVARGPVLPARSICGE